MSLINCNIYLELRWIENCILSSDRNFGKFKVTDDKLHVPIVTLSTKDNLNLTKQLRYEFKRSVYWNRHETKSAKVINNATFQDVKILFALAYNATDDNEAGIKNKIKCFLQREEIENYHVLTDSRNCYDQPINDLIKQYD